MCPIKKPRIMNKRRSETTEESHDKDGVNSIKRKIRKRKLSEMLGSEWSKEELEQFYKAYHKYGTNWEKVAGAICTKSLDMAKALYDINRAYLSLPESQRTADAFVAMMTDHYNILERSDNEQQNKDVHKITSKPQKRCCGKLPADMLKNSDSLCPNNLQKNSTSSCHASLPLLKKNHYGDILGGIIPRVVGKRTPRVPVIGRLHDGNHKDHILSSNKEVSKSKVNSADGLHGIELASAGTSQRGGSPQASGASGRRTDNTRSSPVVLSERKNAERDHDNTNYIDIPIEVKCLDGSLGSRETVNKGFARDDTRLNSEHSGRYETQWNGKFQQKRLAGPNRDYHQYNDAREVCGGTEDELSPLEALRTLADLAISFFSPSTAGELEPYVHAKKQKGNTDFAHKYNVPSLASMNNEGDCSRRSAKLVKALPSDKSSSKGDRQNYLTQTIKQNSLQAKVSVEDRKPSCFSQLVPPPKRARSGQTAECASLHTDLGRKEMDSTKSTSPISTSNMPGRPRNRRKMSLQKAIVQKELRTTTNIGGECLNRDLSSVDSKTADTEETLFNCLSYPLLRRWCMFEWFYSAVDYPWFANREFVNYLKHVKLACINKLNRTEWGMIRSSLGKPRLFSKNFLLEERKKLEQYRESVRTRYAEMHSLPSDLAQPLSVGQQIIARHPKTEGVHDGSILTADHNRLRVQFNSSDLGVQFVMDVDCMPLDPRENLPADLRNQNVMVAENCNNYTEGNNRVVSLQYPSTTMTLNKKPSTLTQIQAMEADNRALPELSFEEKVALTTGLRHMNDEVSGEQDGCLVSNFEQFKKQYAMVDSGPLNLRQRNSFVDDSAAPCFSSEELLAPDETPGFSSTYGPSQNLGYRVAEFVESSRQQARMMVASTLQSGEALGSVSYQYSDFNPWTSDSSSTQTKSSRTFEAEIVHAFGRKVHISSEAEGQVPWELISDCVATYLMIQTCAKGPHPPAEAVEILERLAACLRPCCPDNFPIYTEIETSMGYIKTQILARVPTVSDTILTEASL